MIRIWIGFAATFVIVALGASPAQATFPGRNGVLAVQGLSGHGIEYVTPSGVVVRTVCSHTAWCGNAQEARWSPDGRNLVFIDAASSTVELVSADDICMWCLPGSPLTKLRGRHPAFAPDGQSVTLAGVPPDTRPGLWRASLTAGSSSNLLSGPLSDAVWSSTGELALVRNGAVWARTGGRRPVLHRLSAGGAPSWSPDGRQLAISRGGWITVLDLKRSRLHRLARGTAPAWSPDGTQIAYVDAGQVLRVIPAAGGRSRSLRVPARFVDWQPLPRHGTRGCGLPPGSTVTVARAEAVLSSRNVITDGFASPAWFGCVRGIGKQRQLLVQYTGGGEYSTLVTGASTAGRFGLLSTSSGGKYDACGYGLTRYDLATGASGLLFGQSTTCGGSGMALPSIDSIALDSSGFAAWRVTHQVPLYQPLTGVSCPEIAFCAMVDGTGNVATSGGATGGRPAWSFADISGTEPLGAVSCASATLCVATTGYRGDVLTSTDPTGGAASWTLSHIDDNPIASFTAGSVSCPSISLCVVADAGGNLITSTDPTGGSSAWTAVDVDSASPPGFTGISCASASLCVALDDAGDVATTSDPTGGAPAWSVTHIGTGETIPPFGGVSCPSTTLCVVADGTGDVATSANPTGGSSAWSLVKLPAGRPGAISCPSVSLCVAVDSAGNVVSSTDPAGAASAWQVTNVDGANQMTSISCPTTTRCIATDNHGNVLTSDDPTGGANAWTVAPVDVPDCATMKTPCIAETLYARDDHGTRVIDSAPPGTGKSLANVQMFGNSTTLSWTHDGQQREAALG